MFLESLPYVSECHQTQVLREPFSVHLLQVYGFFCKSQSTTSFISSSVIGGEIEDESDKTPKVQYTRLDDDTIIASGEMELDVINEIFGTTIAKGADYASLNGLLHEKLKDIPQEGDRIQEGPLRMIVEKVRDNVSERIRIEKKS